MLIERKGKGFLARFFSPLQMNFTRRGGGRRGGGLWFFFCFFFLNFKKIFILGSVGSSFLCQGLLHVRQAGATLHRGTRASSLSRPLLLRSTGSRRAGSVIVAHGPSCSVACGIFPDQGLTRVLCISRQTLYHCATR